MTALLAVLGVRFNALPFKLIACAGVSLTLVLGLVMIYREGRHSAERAATIGLAKHNAEIAAKYMRDTEAAEAATRMERARAEDLAKQVATLKEQVSHVAKGAASPGVDAAIHGMHARPAAP